MRAVLLVLLVVPVVRAESPAKEPAKEPFAAIAYFDANCARCHGPGGSFYGEGFGKTGVENLREVVDRMASGPGQAPIEGEALDREVAYHRAMIDKKPFVAVTDARGAKGEVTPGSKVTVSTGAAEIVAKVEESTWTAELPAGTKLSQLTITAEKDGKKTVLKPAEKMYSHSK